ncbi:type VI secretion system protein ImpA [Oxalobacteraceae bacterium GrIS 2.11]
MKALKKSYTKLLGSGTLTETVPAQFLEPNSEVAPCGINLEYDNEFAVLRSRLEPRAEVQYGSFTSKSDEPDWGEIERDCCRLLLRSKDITILIWYIRCRARNAGASGLAQGLAALHGVVSRFEQDVHPQLKIDDCIDPAVRANALAALCDPDGVLSDIRQIVVSTTTAVRLTVREVERAFAVPRLPNALEPDAVKRQLADLYRRKEQSLYALLSAGVYAQQIIEWAKQNLKEESPDLQALQELLATVTVFSQGMTMPGMGEAEKPVNADRFVPPIFKKSPMDSVTAPAQPAMNMNQQRENIRQMLTEARLWIEHNEPSSPVAVLLKQAERLWGKRFSEVAHFIPPDLLKAWDED